MAFHASPQSTTFVTGGNRDYGDPPTLPQDVVDRFPALQSYQAEMDDWWRTTKANLRELESDLATLRNKVNAL